ncbi:zinc metalloproteinase nas-4-like [Limulus polyphemus]|uniref:Metalloendopeptidase n=1 Tax=Limulus polyphemus TaxID=6850 RepID=A0ABM1BBG2_LIMPO|nr:zinc metalloproteinase nas-4-like [Limulus polyphemus]
MIFVVFLLMVGFTFASKVESNETFWSPMEGDLFEGDIKLVPGQIDFERNAVLDRSSRWPQNTIYYKIDSVFSSAQREVILQAMEEYHKHTCIKFVERSNEENYIFIHSSAGCWSHVGKVGGSQEFSLQIPACINKGIIMHEMMHTIGFWHEQSRADRDHYVNIHWDNIRAHQKHNFNKYTLFEVDHLEETYDYKSIMHYHAWAFALDFNKPTLSSKSPSVSLNDLGVAVRLEQFTDGDKRKINKYYEC